MSWHRDPVSLLVAAGEGLGNRFVIAHEAALQAAGVHDHSAFARQVCAEKWDGLLLFGACLRDHDEAEIPATVINRDGSDGGVCLNGLRVLALLVGGHSGVFFMGGHRVRWRRCERGVELEIAQHDLGACAVSQPFALTIAGANAGGRSARAVAFWNPHCLIEVAEPQVENLGAWAAAARARSDLFPHGVNVELVSRPESGVRHMRVDERGVGETAACGSGAVAVAMAAWEAGAGPSLQIIQRGGDLLLERFPGGSIRLSGAAQVICRTGPGQSFDRLRKSF